MDIEIIEEKLDKLFDDAIGVEDTIWYSETETFNIMQKLLCTVAQDGRHRQSQDADQQHIRGYDEQRSGKDAVVRANLPAIPRRWGDLG
jgi:hypothetical protein